MRYIRRDQMLNLAREDAEPGIFLETKNIISIYSLVNQWLN